MYSQFTNYDILGERLLLNVVFLPFNLSMPAVQAAWSLNALQRPPLLAILRNFDDYISFLFVLVGTYCLLRQRCAKQAAVTLPRRELEPDKPARYYYSIAYAQFLRDGKKNFQQIYILQDHVPQSINQLINQSIEIFCILKQFYVSTYVFSSLDVTWINK